MTYIDRIAADISAELGDTWDDLSDDDKRLYRIYALLAKTNLGVVSLEDVHDAWAVWRMETRPDHPSIVPFDELAPDVQELDRKYADAIREIGYRLSYGGTPS